MSFLKWAGGKRRIMPFINELLLPYDKTGDFIEPFVGGGSVISAIEGFPNKHINDINTNLVSVYHYLQDYTELFIEETRQLFTPENNCLEAFTRLKAEYNSLEDGDWRKASIFVYLNKHGFNGMYRVNSKGQYNIPFGKYKTTSFPEANMRKFVEKLANVMIYNQDYKDIMDMALPGDVIYCDPPYLPLSPTANFSSYEKTGFSLDEQQTLADKADFLGKQGVIVLISNHDTPIAREIYSAAHIVELDVQRTIGASVQSRIKVPELIALYGV